MSGFLNSHRKDYTYILIFLTLNVLFSKAYAISKDVRFAFNASSCDTMEPFYAGPLDTVTTTTEGAIAKNVTNSDGDPTPSQEPTVQNTPQIELVTDAIFKIRLNETVYRRNRVIQIDLEALTEEVRIEGYAIQIRPVSDDNEDERQKDRVGNFVGDKDKMEMVQKCEGDKSEDTFLFTGPNFSSETIKNRNTTTVFWKAPDEPSGDIIADAAVIVSGTKYWRGKSEQTLTFNEFPPSRRQCGLEKGCVRIGRTEKDGCSPDGCEYFLTWQLTDDNKTVEFIMGGKVRANQYLGIGFLNASGMYPINMTLLSCNRLTETQGEIKSYFLADKKVPASEIQSDFQNSVTDHDGPDKFWCKFTRPFVPSVPEDSTIPPLDFSENLTLIYIIGKLNDSMPNLPEKLLFGGAEGAWSTMEPIMVSRYVGLDIVLSSTGTTIKLGLLNSIYIILCFLHYSRASSLA